MANGQQQQDLLGKLVADILTGKSQAPAVNAQGVPTSIARPEEQPVPQGAAVPPTPQPTTAQEQAQPALPSPQQPSPEASATPAQQTALPAAGPVGAGQPQAPGAAGALNRGDLTKNIIEQRQALIREQQQEEQAQVAQQPPEEQPDKITPIPIDPDPTLNKVLGSSSSALRKVNKSGRFLKTKKNVNNSLKNVTNLIETNQRLLDKHFGDFNPSDFENPGIAKAVHDEGLEGLLKSTRRIRADKNAELARLRRDLKNKKLNPNQFWQNHGVANTLVMGISAALGEYGKTLAGGQVNTALKVINDAISRDWESQKAELSTLLELHDATAKDIDRLNEQEKHDLSSLSASEKLALSHKVQMMEVSKAQIEMLRDQIKDEVDKEAFNDTLIALEKAQIDAANQEDKIDLQSQELALKKAMHLAKLKKDSTKLPAKQREKISTFNNLISTMKSLKDRMKKNPDILDKALATGEVEFWVGMVPFKGDDLQEIVKRYESNQ